MESGSLDVLALHASVVHLNQLWEDSGSLGDDSSALDESIKMYLSQVSKLVLNWKIFDSDENLFGGVLVVRIHFRYELFSHCIEDWEHKCGLLCQPNGESRVHLTEIRENNFQRLQIVLTHLVDLVLIDIVSGFVLELSQEGIEFAPNEDNDIVSL